jgi:hypothetical protein
VSTASRLQAGRPRIRGLIPGKGKGFSLLYNVQIESTAHPASCPMRTEARIAARSVANYSPPSTAEVNNGGAIPVSNTYKLLLAFSSTAILGSEFHGAHGHIVLQHGSGN